MMRSITSMLAIGGLAFAVMRWMRRRPTGMQRIMQPVQNAMGGMNMNKMMRNVRGMMNMRGGLLR